MTNTSEAGIKTGPAGEPAIPAQTCDNPRVERGNADALRVQDAMLASPKTVAADASTAELRALFSNPHVRMALIVDGPDFVGVVERHQVPDLPERGSARSVARRDVPTVEPGAPLSAALTVLDSGSYDRLVVLDPDGVRLRGLLCLTSDRNGFCQS